MLIYFKVTGDAAFLKINHITSLFEEDWPCFIVQNNMFFTIIVTVISENTQEFLKFYVLQFCIINLLFCMMISPSCRKKNCSPWSHWPNFYWNFLACDGGPRKSAKILNVEPRYFKNEKTPEWMTSEKICFIVRFLFLDSSSLLGSFPGCICNLY